ncbi:MAG: helix-turn-helix domain-containing protein [Pseudomonadota bacterium]
MSPRDCPVRGVIDGIGDKWSVLVILHLNQGSHRFSRLMSEIGDISQRMLTVTLRKLERDGLVQRTVTPTRPPRVDYALTDLGASLVGQLQTMADWAVANRATIDAARDRFDSTAGEA